MLPERTGKVKPEPRRRERACGAGAAEAKGTISTTSGMARKTSAWLLQKTTGACSVSPRPPSFRTVDGAES